MADEEKVQVREVPRPAGMPKVNWKTENMRSAYANVCNATCTREEVVLFFGLNQAWSGQEEEVTVQLAERVILSPKADSARWTSRFRAARRRRRPRRTSLHPSRSLVARARGFVVGSDYGATANVIVPV